MRLGFWAEDLLRRAAHVVVAEEGRRLGIAAVRQAGVVVLLQAVRDTEGAGYPGGVARGGGLEREVEDVRHPLVADVRHLLERVVVVDLAEDLEVRHARGLRGFHDRRHPELEEAGVDVRRRVDAEAVDVEPRDPRRVDRGEPVLDLRLLGEEVVEPEEVAPLEARRAAAGEVDVAAVVVVERVVQPRRVLRVRVGRRGEVRLLRHVVRAQAREGALADVLRRVEVLAVAVAVRGTVVVARVGKLDDVAGVVDDDVLDHLHPERVGAGDEVGEVLIRAEMRIDVHEVGAPVAVIAAGAPVGDLVRDGRRDPDRVEAERLEPREAVSRRCSAPVRPLKSPPCHQAVDVGSYPVWLTPPLWPPRSFDGSPFAYRSVITK